QLAELLAFVDILPHQFGTHRIQSLAPAVLMIRYFRLWRNRTHSVSPWPDEMFRVPQALSSPSAPPCAGGDWIGPTRGARTRRTGFDRGPAVQLPARSQSGASRTATVAASSTKTSQPHRRWR